MLDLNEFDFLSDSLLPALEESCGQLSQLAGELRRLAESPALDAVPNGVGPLRDRLAYGEWGLYRLRELLGQYAGIVREAAEKETGDQDALGSGQ